MARLRLRRRDAGFLLLLLLALIGVGGSVWSGSPATPASPSPPSPGARAIDRRRLDVRLGDGTLQRREAEWYRPAGDGR